MTTDGKTIELPVTGLDCAECAARVRSALEKLPGAESVEVFLAAGRVRVRCDPAILSSDDLVRAI